MFVLMEQAESALLCTGTCTLRDANAHTRTMSFPHLNSQGLHSHHAHPEYAELHLHAQGHIQTFIVFIKMA